ncbi:MAG: transcriptional regulator [Clostridia bacterium]|nr:transcriptional regulator [Clostridia bacterium]
MKKNELQREIDFQGIDIGNTRDYIRYAIDMERCLNDLQKRLSCCKTPQEVAFTSMKAITEFYDAEMCAFITADTELGVWNTYWWYDQKDCAMVTKQSNEWELTDHYGRWLNLMKNHEPMIIEDVEAIKESHPDEYKSYQKLGVKSILAVPFWMHVTGFLVLKNVSKYNNQTGLLRLLNYAIVNAFNEHRLVEMTKHSLASPRISSDSDVYISLFGEMKITTSRGIITESELKSPKIARVLTYLLLIRKAAVSPREIVDAIWPEEEADVPGSNMKGLIYRLQQAFSLISDYRLIESTPNGYRLNPKLNIITDLRLFDDKRNMALTIGSNEDKTEILKKIVDLYKGDVLQSASSEHWLLGTAANYQHRYIGVVNELMKILWEEKRYHHIHRYAAKALEIVPRNADIHYWLIRSMSKQGHSEMARSEMKMAECNLLSEEFSTLTSRLRSEPGHELLCS